jgi:hypothetical protein
MNFNSQLGQSTETELFDVMAFADKINDMLEPFEAPNQKFAEIILDFYDAIDQEPPSFEGLRPLDPIAFRVEVNDVKFSMSYTVHADDMVCVTACFGRIPEEKEVTVLYKMMELNLVLFTHSTSIFYVDPNTRNMMFGYRLELKDLTSSVLFDSFKAVSRQAHQWRKTYFLDEADLTAQFSGMPSFSPLV